MLTYKKIISYSVLIGAILVQFLGLFWFLALTFCLGAALLGFLLILFTSQNNEVEKFLEKDILDPLEEPKTLGLKVCANKKLSIRLISPNIKIQTESKSKGPDSRKKSLLDSGIDLLFNKQTAKHIKDGIVHKKHSLTDHSHLKNSDEHNSSTSHHPHHQWNVFENIKIYTDRKKRHSVDAGTLKKEELHYGVECSPKKSRLVETEAGPSVDSAKKLKILTGNKEVDKLLHTIVDYVIRDFIDSWFSSLSDNKEFVDHNSRSTIEEFILNICKRIKQSDLLPTITNKLVENVANHAKLYRLASKEVNDDQKQKKKMPTPQLRHQSKHLNEHRRNKSDTDLKWNLGAANIQKNVANSTFYSVQTDEAKLINPEKQLVEVFFNHCSDFEEESANESQLESHLTNVMETILFYTLSKEDFSCMTLRAFLATLLANVVFKPVVNMVADPDFINLQIARQFTKDPPSGEFLLKMIRQCQDLSELRAVRQLITQEMDLKFKDANCTGELASLKYTQKLIDIRIGNLQNHRNFSNNLSNKYIDKEKIQIAVLLSLDEIISKELALSYYLDYLSILNLQKYVIFYLMAQEWRTTLSKTKTIDTQDEAQKQIRDKAFSIFKEYLVPTSHNYLNIDTGLIEVLHIRIKDTFNIPEISWFDSICKFIYEKLKNEPVFLSNFYQSSAYRKLLLELDVVTQSDIVDIPSDTLDGKLTKNDDGSNSASNELLMDDDEDFLDFHVKEEREVARKQSQQLLDPNIYKHQRSHSDTGLIAYKTDMEYNLSPKRDKVNIPQLPANNLQVTDPDLLHLNKKLSAKIINTAINSEGHFAVYAIQVTVIEDQQHKSWHIYRRYSKFLELKKFLMKRFPNMTNQLPFPGKKTFHLHTTQRSVLEHRMHVLNEFLEQICDKADHISDLKSIIREFLEPDTDDKLQGGIVIRTFESLVNPLKTGMRTIRNMPDSFFGGLSKILTGKGPLKDNTYYDDSEPPQSSEYPALTSMLNLMDEVFDLKSRSQWLRRGLLNRLLGASWISHQANKKILQTAKSFIGMDKVEAVLVAILNNVWPDGVRGDRQQPREDNTKLRTRMAAKIALFALLSDDLRHILGSETTRFGLLNFYEMLQHPQLNKRLALVLIHDLLTAIFPADEMTKHVIKD